MDCILSHQASCSAPQAPSLLLRLIPVLPLIPLLSFSICSSISLLVSLISLSDQVTLSYSMISPTGFLCLQSNHNHNRGNCHELHTSLKLLFCCFLQILSCDRPWSWCPYSFLSLSTVSFCLMSIYNPFGFICKAVTVLCTTCW